MGGGGRRMMRTGPIDARSLTSMFPGAGSTTRNVYSNTGPIALLGPALSATYPLPSHIVAATDTTSGPLTAVHSYPTPGAGWRVDGTQIGYQQSNFNLPGYWAGNNASAPYVYNNVATNLGGIVQSSGTGIITIPWNGTPTTGMMIDGYFVPSGTYVLQFMDLSDAPDPATGTGTGNFDILAFPPDYPSVSILFRGCRLRGYNDAPGFFNASFGSDYAGDLFFHYCDFGGPVASSNYLQLCTIQIGVYTANNLRILRCYFSYQSTVMEPNNVLWGGYCDIIENYSEKMTLYPQPPMVTYAAGGTAQTTASATCTVTLTHAVPVDDTLVVAWGNGTAGTDVSSVTDTYSQSWTVFTSNSSPGLPCGFAVCAPVQTAFSAGDTITLTWSSSVTGAAAAAGVNQPPGEIPYPDVTAGAGGTGTSVSASTGGLSAMNEICLGVLVGASGAGAGSGFNWPVLTQEHASGKIYLALCDFQPGGTIASQTFSANITSAAWGAGVLALNVGGFHMNGHESDNGNPSSRVLRNNFVFVSPDEIGMPINQTDCISFQNDQGPFPGTGTNADGSTGYQVIGNYVGGTGYCFYLGENTAGAMENMTFTGNLITASIWPVGSTAGGAEGYGGGYNGPTAYTPPWTGSNVQANNLWADGPTAGDSFI